MTLPAIIWIDRLGRRPALIIGAFVMMIWLFISGSLQAAYGEPNHDPSINVTWALVNKKSQSKAIVACSYLFVATSVYSLFFLFVFTGKNDWRG